MPVRVLVLNERDARHPRAGGAEVHVAEIFGRLAGRGFEVTQAACSFPGAPPRERVDGLDIHRLARLPFYYPRAAWICARETRRGRFDLVVECLNKLPFYAPLYSRAPVLALCHHLFGEVAFNQVPWPVAAVVWTAERGIPLLYRRVPFVTISESSRADLVARGLPRDQIRVIPCGVRRPEIEPPPLASRPQRVVYFGRLEPYKRVDVLLRAMAKLAPRWPEVETVVIGRGTGSARLETLARDLGLESRVRFTGFVPDAERDALVAGARVCVCASIKEGWGLTVIEANALGTPVVASDAPGLRESVRDGETGFLVAEGDVDGFAARIGTLLQDDALAGRFSCAALAWSHRFDWDDAARQMEGVLHELRGTA